MNNVMSIGSVFAIVIISVISSFIVGGAIMGFSASSPEQINKLYLYISFFIGQGVILIPPIYFLTVKKQPIYESLRIRAVSLSTIKNTLIFSTGILILFDTLDKIIRRFITTPDYIIDLGEIMRPDSALGYIFLFLAVVIIAPIGEEIVFRGFLQKFLEKYWRDTTRAILVTSLFFAMIHFNPFWTIQIYLLGIILGFLAWKTRSVIPSILLHIVNNGAAFILANIDEKTMPSYLWKDQVAPFFIFLAIFLIYKGLEKINLEED